MFGVVAWLANLVLVVLVNWLYGGRPDLLSWRNLMVGLVFGLVSGLVIGLRAKFVSPRAMAIRLPKRSDLSSSVLLGGLGLGLLFGLVFGLVSGLWGANERLGEALRDGLIFGILFGLIALLAFWLVEAWHVPVAASLDVSPWVLYQKNMRSLLIEGPVVGVMGGFAVWVMAAVAGRQGLRDALPAAIAGGLVFALLAALRSAAGRGAALSLLVTEIALRLKARRVQFIPLLQTALEKQVLRQAGAVYQFRHADLQDRLADRFEAGLVQRRAT
jgi:hypothetical protein